MRKAVAAGLVQLGDRRVLEPLLKSLRDPGEEACLTAAGGLGRFQQALAFEPLVRCLRESKDEHHRGRAAEALATLGDHRAVEPLKKSLTDAKKHVRQASVKALGKLGDAACIDAVARLLADAEPDVQLAAAEALARLGDSRGYDLMIATLLTEGLQHRVLAAIAGLDVLGDPRAVAPLVLSLRGSWGKVRRAIMRALVKMGAPAAEALKPLLADPRPLVRGDARAVLDRIAAQPPDGPAAVPSPPAAV